MILQRLFDRQQTAAMIWQLTYGKKVEISATTTTTKIHELETTIRRLKIWTVLRRAALLKTAPKVKPK